MLGVSKCLTRASSSVADRRKRRAINHGAHRARFSVSVIVHAMFRVQHLQPGVGFHQPGPLGDEPNAYARHAAKHFVRADGIERAHGISRRRCSDREECWFSSDHLLEVRHHSGRVVLEDVAVVHPHAGPVVGIPRIVAAITAGKSASQSVKEAKFCEVCKLYMEADEPRRLSFAAVKEAAKSFTSNDIPTVAAALVPVPKETEEAALRLFHCLQCRNGFADIKVTFAAQWPKKGKPNQFENMAETWLAVSRALPTSEFDVLSKAPDPKLATVDAPQEVSAIR